MNYILSLKQHSFKEVLSESLSVESVVSISGFMLESQ